MPDGDGDGYPKCFDPYLRYAISTNFTNFELFKQKKFEFFDDENFKLFFFVEFKQAELATAFARAMGEFGAEFGPGLGKSRYATMRSRKAAVVDPGTVTIWNTYVSRVELSLPLKQTEEKGEALLERWKLAKEPPQLLIGLLDDGCPFAAAHFLKTSAGAVSTRVRAIWDQNQGKLPAQIYDAGNLCVFGQKPTDFTYGLEYVRDSVPPSGPRQLGLDEWIKFHSTTGSIDEDGCYADAGFTSLARGQSHGAHVMDVFAGLIPTSSRVGPSPPGDRRDPPSWKLATDPASSADVVFVQFSEDCIRDATGVWLKAFVFQGIQFILSFADPDNTEHVIINLSYGPTTGPHDGTAELEAALSAFVAEYNGTTHKRPKLEIVLAAGNAYLSEGHVFFTSDSEEPQHVEWTWRLPPDNTALCFAEVWMDDADADGVTVTLTSPSGLISTSTTGPMPPPTGIPGPSYTGVYAPLVWGNSTVWLLAVQPTIAAPGFVSEHGDYTIKVDGIPENAEVHAYVARSDPNMGVRTGAKRSYFVDPNWEQTRSADASCTRIDGEFDKTGSLVHRDGTLNGIATAKKHRVHVAGGYILSNGRKSTYSSEGPARHGPRVGPDVVLPCDESYALEGIRAGGNRSGAVFRLTGTSTAAPQLARHVTNPPIPSPNDIPTTLEEIRKRGGGDLEPP
jgi:hypothetical protein